MAQEKVTLRDTEIGVLVKKRLKRPDIDKSAELRRLIELGYAAEQAGFILDGVVLRHAGKTWYAQPSLNAETIPQPSYDVKDYQQPERLPAAGEKVAATATDRSSPQPGPLSVEQASNKNKNGDLTTRLRGLSG